MPLIGLWVLLRDQTKRGTDKETDRRMEGRKETVKSWGGRGEMMKTPEWKKMPLFFPKDLKNKNTKNKNLRQKLGN